MKSRDLYIAQVPRTTTTDELSNRVRHYRRLRELTQADLAKAVEVSRQTVVSIEAGDYSPSVHLALRVASTLETTVEALFGNEEQ